MTYIFTYDGTNPPKWEKILEASNGETFTVSLVFENEEDRLILNAEQAYEHMENMLQYVKDKTANLSLVGLDESIPNTFWPVHGNYDSVEQTMQEIQKWWRWAYFNDAFDENIEEEEESA